MNRPHLTNQQYHNKQVSPGMMRPNFDERMLMNYSSETMRKSER